MVKEDTRVCKNPEGVKIMKQKICHSGPKIIVLPLLTQWAGCYTPEGVLSCLE